jgi:hypothetical protein
MVTSTGLDKTPSSCLVRLHLRSRIQSQNDRSRSQPMVFNNSHFRMVFNSRPSSRFRKSFLLVDHTVSYQIFFNNGETDWCLSIVIISGTDVLLIPIWTLLQIVREITEPLHRKHDALSCGITLVKFCCGFPFWSTLELNLTNWKTSAPQLPFVYTCHEQDWINDHMT